MSSGSGIGFYPARKTPPCPSVGSGGKVKNKRTKARAAAPSPPKALISIPVTLWAAAGAANGGPPNPFNRTAWAATGATSWALLRLRDQININEWDNQFKTNGGGLLSGMLGVISQSIWEWNNEIIYPKNHINDPSVLRSTILPM